MDLKGSLDPDFARKQWRWQRVGWAAMLLVVVATLGGVFGGGFLAHASSAAQMDGASYQLDYQRIDRFEHDSMFFVRVHAPAGGDSLNVTLSPSLADSITVITILPDADATSLGSKGAKYTWQVDDWGAPLVVAFNYKPKSGGLHDGLVEVEADGVGAHAFTLKRFIFT